LLYDLVKQGSTPMDYLFAGVLAVLLLSIFVTYSQPVNSNNPWINGTDVIDDGGNSDTDYYPGGGGGGSSSSDPDGSDPSAETDSGDPGETDSDVSTSPSPTAYPNHGLAWMPVSDYLAKLGNTETEPTWDYLSPVQLVEWCKDNGMSMVMLNCFNHLGYTKFAPPYPTTSTGDTVYGKSSYVDDYIDNLRAAGIYYTLDIWRFWHGLERQNRHPEDFANQDITTGDYKPYLLEIAKLIGERFGDDKYFIGVTWDFEYAGWSSASATGRAGPEFDNDKEKFYQWLYNPNHEGGFLWTIAQYKPEVRMGLQPNGQYVNPAKAEDIRTSFWINHLNMRNDGDYWGKVENYQTATKGYPQLAGGVSVENGELDWHVEHNHVWHYGNDWTSPYGLREHILYWVLFNPNYISVWSFTHETQTLSCPICGRTELTWSKDETDVCKRLGNKLDNIPYQPEWIATWGDLGKPNDGIPGIYGDPTPWVTAETKQGIGYMLTTDRIWIVNISPSAKTVTIQYTDKPAQQVTVQGYDFETVNGPEYWRPSLVIVSGLIFFLAIGYLWVRPI